MVSTDVGVIGGSGLNDWMECRGASWIAVPIFRNTMLLGATWRLDTVTSATGFVICLKTNCHLDDSPLCAITLALTGWVSIFCSQSASSWSFYFARGLELLECIWCNL